MAEIIICDRATYHIPRVWKQYGEQKLNYRKLVDRISILTIEIEVDENLVG